MLHLSSQKLDSTLKSNQCSVYVILEFIITNDQCSCACQVHWSLNFFTDLSDDRSYSRHAAWRTTVTVCDSTQVGCESITQIWLSGHVHIESICQLGCQHHIIQSPHRSVTFLSSDLSPSYLA